MSTVLITKKAGSGEGARLGSFPLTPALRRGRLWGRQPEGPTESSSVLYVELTLLHGAHSVTAEQTWRQRRQSSVSRAGADLGEFHTSQFPTDPGVCGADGDRNEP